MQNNIINLLEKNDAPIPGVDALLNALDDVMPQLKNGESILADPFIRLSLTDCPPSLHRQVEEMCAKANKRNGNTEPRGVKAKPPAGKEPGTKKSANPGPAVKEAPAPPAKGPPAKPKPIATAPSNPPPGRAARPTNKHTPPGRDEASRTIGRGSRPPKTYQEIEDSSGESGSEYEEEMQKEKDKKSSHPRKVIKTPAVITSEMDEDVEEDGEEWEHADGEDADGDGTDGEDAVGRWKEKRKAKGGEEITWSQEDRFQEKLDLAWKHQDEEDPVVQAMQKGTIAKTLKTGPFYWGPYNAPLEGGEEAIAFDLLANPRINPHDNDNFAKYILVDIYREPCGPCIHTNKTCFFGGSKPNPLGKTVEQEQANAGACGECKAGKKRCFGKGRGRYRTIIRNPFYGGHKKAEGKVKTEGRIKMESKPRPATKAKTSNSAAATTSGRTLSIADGKLIFTDGTLTDRECRW